MNEWKRDTKEKRKEGSEPLSLTMNVPREFCPLRKSCWNPADFLVVSPTFHSAVKEKKKLTGSGDWETGIENDRNMTRSISVSDWTWLYQKKHQDRDGRRLYSQHMGSKRITMSPGLAWATQQIQCKPELHSKTMFLQSKKNQKPKETSSTKVRTKLKINYKRYILPKWNRVVKRMTLW